MKYCGNCGTANENEMNYCCECGFELNQSKNINEVKKKSGFNIKELNSLIVLGIALGLFCLLLLITALK